MYVSTPDKALLKILWDIVAANGRSPQVSFDELSKRLVALQAVGLVVYPFSMERDIKEAVAADTGLLAEWGLVRVTDGTHAELTGAGELLAGTLEYPEWAQATLASSA